MTSSMTLPLLNGGTDTERTEIPLSAASGGVQLSFEDQGTESSHRAAPANLDADATNFHRAAYLLRDEANCSPAVGAAIDAALNHTGVCFKGRDPPQRVELSGLV